MNNLVHLLKRIEWNESNGLSIRPDCGGTKPRHDYTCALEAMLDHAIEESKSAQFRAGQEPKGA